jgi:hypothetical protein
MKSERERERCKERGETYAVGVQRLRGGARRRQHFAGAQAAGEAGEAGEAGGG